MTFSHFSYIYLAEEERNVYPTYPTNFALCVWHSTHFSVASRKGVKGYGWDYVTKWSHMAEHMHPMHLFETALTGIYAR